MSELIEQAIELHKAGMSMADIGSKLGKSAAWVCKGFKRVGYVQSKERYNKYALTEAEGKFVLENKAKPYDWIGAQLGKSAHSISQWLKKRGVSKNKPANVGIRECECCKTQYKPAQASQKFCSIKCMGDSKSYLTEVECAHCKTLFMPSMSGRKFCSVECGQEGYQSQHIKVRPYSYSGVKMRSTWEVKFAQWLDSKGYEWKYEPTFFALPNRKRYCPDFFVPTHNAYYEIKGWMKDEAAEKIRQFRSLYPQESLVLVNKETFKLYGVKV